MPDLVSPAAHKNMEASLFISLFLVWDVCPVQEPDPPLHSLGSVFSSAAMHRRKSGCMAQLGGSVATAGYMGPTDPCHITVGQACGVPLST